MKHMKKAFSLIMALVMVICLAVPAFAASTDNATVTVYVTTGMFTEGGYDEVSGQFVKQQYRAEENPADHLFNGYSVVTTDGKRIAENLSTIRAVYSAPDTLSSDVNVLDAIIYALQAKGFTCFGGWDSYTKPNGGYVYSVTPGGVPESDMEDATIGGVDYTKYFGTGWQIAVKSGNSFEALSNYGTTYPITNGMVIVFDLSPYVIYD